MEVAGWSSASVFEKFYYRLHRSSSFGLSVISSTSNLHSWYVNWILRNIIDEWLNIRSVTAIRNYMRWTYLQFHPTQSVMFDNICLFYPYYCKQPVRKKVGVLIFGGLFIVNLVNTLFDVSNAIHTHYKHLIYAYKSCFNQRKRVLNSWYVHLILLI